MEKKQNVPALRFQGFSGEWKRQRFGEVATFINGRAYAQSELLSAGKYKVLRVGNFYTNSAWYYSNLELSDKYYANRGDLLYTWSATFGPHIWDGDKVIYHYHIWKIEVKEQLEKLFFLQLLERDKKNLLNDTNGSTMVHITKLGMENKTDFIPNNIDEQSKIGQFCSQINCKIEKEKRKIQKLQQFRQAMLTKLFPREGAAEPELRFRGFSGKWKVEQFSKLVFIERGGSPRPIDSYITNADDGLNWVKIGDAPKYGIYITHTAEKIKPVGLSMTRQVYPGDLILSNSMSFGRPYIMAITGCIHDGWLLIRNSNKIFDLNFLYCLLGSSNVLKQYKALASGSTVNNLNKALVGSVIIQYPPMEEQKRIGKFFDQLDSYISLQQKKLERMQRLKAALLEKLFV